MPHNNSNVEKGNSEAKLRQADNIDAFVNNVLLIVFSLHTAHLRSHMPFSQPLEKITCIQ